MYYMLYVLYTLHNPFKVLAFVRVPVPGLKIKYAFFRNFCLRYVQCLRNEKKSMTFLIDNGSKEDILGDRIHSFVATYPVPHATSSTF